MSNGLYGWGSKDDQARRNAVRVGRGNNGMEDERLTRRIAERKRKDEDWAQNVMGVRLTYADLPMRARF